MKTIGRLGRWGRASNPLVLCLFLPLTGCFGATAVHIIPLGTKRISETEPLVTKVRPQRCFYWVNDRNELCLAMRDRNRSILGAMGERDTLMTFVLGAPPASQSRDYVVRKGTFRARRRAGLSHVQSESVAGIMAVWDYGKPTLRGRFRLTVQQQSYWVLTGWTGDTRAIIVGEFAATFDPEAGSAIARQLEESKPMKE